MKTKEKVKSITVIGRRWFQRLYGNTYHSLQVYVNGEKVYGYEFEYGYGSMYIQNAAQWLNANGYVDMGDERNVGPGSFSIYCRENGIDLVDSVSDVSRKRDL